MMAGIPARFRRFFRGFRGQPDRVTLIDQKDLNNLKLTGGIGSRTEVDYHFLVEGKGTVTVSLDCLKGGKHSKTVTLK
jgi:hypothetical protein